MSNGRQIIDLATWSRADQFQFFRTFERPHYAITARVDVSALMRVRGDVSVFRACLYAIGCGLHAVPALRMRFKGDVVTLYERLHLSPTIALDNGDFRYTYLRFSSDFTTFDAEAAGRIAKVRAGGPLNANTGKIADVAYLSCLPWLDYSSLDNALPNADDCIPRVSWGQIVPKTGGHDMALTIQVHHALVDGRQVSAFFDATSRTLAGF